MRIRIILCIGDPGEANPVIFWIAIVGSVLTGIALIILSLIARRKYKEMVEEISEMRMDRTVSDIHDKGRCGR